jgi:hypothetical protein
MSVAQTVADQKHLVEQHVPAGTARIKPARYKPLIHKSNRADTEPGMQAADASTRRDPIRSASA